jgi:hypothetical protein
LSIRAEEDSPRGLERRGRAPDAPRSTSHEHAESIQAEQTLRLRLPQQSQPRRVAAVTEQIRECAGLTPDKVPPIANVVREILDELDERHRQQRRREIWLLAVGALLGLVGNMLTALMGRLFDS